MTKTQRLFFLLAIVFAFLITGCNKTTITTVSETTTYSSDTSSAVLPDLTGKSTTEVKETLDATGLTYSLVIKQGLFYGTGTGQYEYEKFYGYSGTNKVGDVYSKEKKLNVYVTAYNLPSSLADLVEENPSLKTNFQAVTLDGLQYENMSFLETGCGEVTVTAYVDGDTTHFRDFNGTNISLRYLGIDTPESTALFEPWGKAASAYTKNALQNASKIVLTAEEPGMADSNGRYLGWVWYLDTSDVWHCLNLDLITFAYTKDKSDTDSSIGSLCTSIGLLIGRTGRRVWGEGDPNYDYSTEPKTISMEELRTNFANYYGRKVKVTGVIALMDNGSVVLVDPETGYGIYYYTGYATTAVTYNLIKGNKVTMEGVATYYGSSTTADFDSMDEDLKNGCPQLSGLSSDTQITLISSNNTVSPKVLVIDQLQVSNIGMYCEFDNLTVTSVHAASTGSGTTVYCRDASGKTINIRVDSSNYFVDKIKTDGVDMSNLSAGKTITKVVGYLSYYSGYQIALVYGNDLTVGN